MINYLKKIGATAAAATCLALATPAAAQMQVYEDYAPTGEVVELTMVKVDEGQFETYLEGLSTTWVAANKVAQELGHISGYSIWGVPYGDNSVNLMLVVRFPSREATGPSKERYDAFMAAWGEANQERSNKTVIELYNKIRKIQGRYLLTEIEMLDDEE